MTVAPNFFDASLSELVLLRRMPTTIAALLLYLLHVLYSLVLTLQSHWKYLFQQPQHSLAQKLPAHLAVLLATNNEIDLEDEGRTLIESVENAVAWCRIVGVDKLTVFDAKGILLRNWEAVRKRVINHDDMQYLKPSDSEANFPLTPPLSDHSDSESPSLSCDLESVTLKLSGTRSEWDKKLDIRTTLRRRRGSDAVGECKINMLTLNVVSPNSSKNAIVCAARSLARTHARKLGKKAKIEFHLSIEQLNVLLEGNGSFSSPDLMIVHKLDRLEQNQSPLELHGFPPWQVRLTEIHQVTYPSAFLRWLRPKTTQCPTFTPLTELHIRNALEQFAKAEIRLGK